MNTPPCLIIDSEHQRNFYYALPPNADITDSNVAAMVAFAAHFSVIFDRRLDHEIEGLPNWWAQVVPNISFSNRPFSEDEWQRINSAARCAFEYADALRAAKDKDNNGSSTI